MRGRECRNHATEAAASEPEGGTATTLLLSVPGRMWTVISAGNDRECRREREVAVHGIDNGRFYQVGTHS
jgi:hypothetical protein